MIAVNCWQTSNSVRDIGDLLFRNAYTPILVSLNLAESNNFRCISQQPITKQNIIKALQPPLTLSGNGTMNPQNIRNIMSVGIPIDNYIVWISAKSSLSVRYFIDLRGFV